MTGTSCITTRVWISRSRGRNSSRNFTARLTRLWSAACSVLAEARHFVLTLEWYYAWQGCGVSPHCDARRKLGTHIFYFNTEADWDSSWGGRILIMDDGGRLKTHSAPAFDDLGIAASLDPRGNGSLLFQRTAHSWHGVRPLESPPGHLRKLFIVTINASTIQVLWRRVRGKDPDGYPLKNQEMPHSIPA